MAMRVALTAAEREFIAERKQAGVSLGQIAAVLGCRAVTVRKWWRRQRARQPAKPRGRPRAGILSTYPVELIEEALALKQTHRHWGPANVKVQLKHDERFGAVRLPSDARLAALFSARCPDQVQRRLKQAYPDQPVAKAHLPHQRWQLDGQERVDLPEIGRVTFMNLRDPLGALIVASRAISTGTAQQWRKVSLPEVQAFLRQAFAEWGLPLEIQTDHEPTYTGPARTDCPSPFTLWLAGLGIAHVTSRDRRPTDQAQVERTHRTLAEMGWLDEPGTSLTALQAVLDDRRQRYNSELPVHASDCRGQPPLVAHPDAVHSGRPFQPALEWDWFALSRVDTYLAQFVWTRRVNTSGNVGFFDQQYTIGRAYAHQTVSLRFLPETRCLHFQLPNGTALPDRPARGLNQEDLIGFLPLHLALTSPWQLSFYLPGV